MRSNWLLAPLLVLVLGLTSLSGGEALAASEERPVSGLVTRVHTLSQTMYLGSERFHVPEDVYDLSELPVGIYAVVTFERVDGEKVATSIEVESEPD